MKKKTVLFGYGYWGSKLARVIHESADLSLDFLVEPNPELQAIALEKHNISIISLEELKRLNDVEVAFIATPSTTHYELIKACLDLGMHVWSEKPFTTTNSQTEELVRLARAKNLQIFVDHTFVYTSSISRLKREILEDGLLEPSFYHSTRCNFAAIQSDGNVIQDLAVHDLGIFFYLYPDSKLKLTSLFEGKGLKTNFYTMASIQLTSEDGKTSINLFYNWLSPIKIRTILLGSGQSNFIYDDMLHVGKLKKYTLPLELVFGQSDVFNMLRQNQIGETIVFPDVDQEALGVAIVAFSNAIVSGKEAPTGATHISLVSEALGKIMVN
jgi:predicted dehydrogenase